MRILVTNDDGIDAPGIQALAAALAEAGHSVLVAAPSYDASGTGAAVGPVHISKRLVFTPGDFDLGPGHGSTDGYSVDGPPALVVMAACLGGFGPVPDLVVSGINDGANTGRHVLHSGTVGAALTAGNHGVSAVAVSVDGHRWQTAATAAVAAVEWIVGEAPGTVVNVNAPDRAIDDVEGVSHAHLATFGTFQTAFELVDHTTLELRFSAPLTEADRGSDSDLVSRGWVALTRIVPVGAAGSQRGDGLLAAAVSDRLSWIGRPRVGAR
jgi:5'-nucleotidase